MAAIITVTFNPALDKTISISKLVPDRKLKCLNPVYEPGGGGINVARAIKKLGGDAVAIYLAGGDAGKRITQLLTEELVKSEVVEIKDCTRENLVVQDIENDTSFKWFKANMQLGTASATAIEAFKKNGSKFKMVVFFGTWCEDSQNLVPIFYRLVDKSGYSDSSITLIAVDRKKTTLDNLHTAFHITNVPTFIVMKDGKEVSRIVEYGKYGEIDKELGEIVAGIQ